MNAYPFPKNTKAALRLFFLFFLVFTQTACSALPSNTISKERFATLVMEAKTITEEAGEILLTYYNNEDISFENKNDNSPVTKADIESNTHIIKRLKQLTPNITIISEETANNTESASLFWLVDPMDGTKSFIKKTDQFTVNIALVENGKPVLGVVHIPVTKQTYFTGPSGGAYKEEDGATKQIYVRKPAEDGMVIVASHSHRTPEDDAFVNSLNTKSFIAASSSIKFCLVAEGKADIYPRFGTTMEWDTAAGSAVLLAAGGNMINKIDLMPFTYGKKNYRNNHFIAYGDMPEEVFKQKSEP